MANARFARFAAYLDQRGTDAPVPPADVLARPLTRSIVATYPDYYISGAGRAQARATTCDHNYNLTDSCPCCP